MAKKQSTEFKSTFKRKLIYIFRVNDHDHKGLLKIGDATLETNKPAEQYEPNCHELNQAAKDRIDSYSSEVGIRYELLHTELAIYRDKKTNKIKAFRDYSVHNVLKRSGIKIKHFDTRRKQNEWFKVDLETAKNAIKCVKENKTALDGSQISDDRDPIVFRPEQEEAIDRTVTRFKTHKKMLWNAKMRFGKTLSALEVVKRMKFDKTIIMTHRPVVNSGWFEDFGKIFYDSPEFQYGSKNNGHKFKDLIKSKKKFVYFASIQDLRGSEHVGGNFDKNNEIFSIDWDFVIVDEAHEGTQTELGKSVIEAITKSSSTHETYQLLLSGTPFNLLTDFESGDIFTWDYIKEQEEKKNWNLYHYGDSNPYDELPRMNIFTYHLEKQYKFIDLDDKAFNFREFFRTWTGDVQKDGKPIPAGSVKGDFVHEKDVKNFLKLICKKGEDTNYPFATEEYRNYFRHSLWIVPGVKEAKALSKLLKADDSPFIGFNIVNVAGAGDEEVENDEALNKVKKAITDNPEKTYTITLSCGKLTTGVSIPEWTAVLMLAGSYSTKASQYLQTIFRVQTPANIDGKIKEDAYVFDFAPDRTLKMVAEAVHLSSTTSTGGAPERIQLGNFLNYCSVISIDGSNMTEYSVDHLIQELKKAYVEKVIRNGFDDNKIYNEELLKLDDIELKEFENLRKIIGQSRQTKRVGEIDINNQGFNDEEWETIEKIKKKLKTQLTEEEKKKLEEYKKKKDNQKTAISILRGISIRMPLLVYGMDKEINVDITVDNFASDSLIDQQSWDEFMPEGVTKEIFKKFSKYYDKDIFVAASRRIRSISKTADELEPTERVQKIADLFSTFKNPDKETVLTPWNVVNMHMSETLGGYDFFDKDHTIISRIDEPRYVYNSLTSSEVFNNETKVLEINSKSGLYPLYITYSLYRTKIDKIKKELSFNEKLEIWDKIVDENIFVVCKTNMAKSITRRTLVGYRNKKINTHAFDDLIMQFKEKPEKFVEKIKKESFWGKGEKVMKFNAVVGNPPYQGTNHQQIYPYFYLTSRMLGDNVSLIFPIGWQEPKNANNLSKLNNKEVKEDKQIVMIDNRQNVFPGVSGAEWTNILLWKKEYDNKLNGKQKIYTNGQNPEDVKLIWDTADIKKPKEIIELDKIVKKTKGFDSIQNITSSRQPFGITTNVFKDKLMNFYDEKKNDKDYTLYGNSNTIKYISSNTVFPKENKTLNKYKVFVPYAWGNMSENVGLGGAFSDIIVAKPGDVCTETYLVSGLFENKNIAKKHAKYLMTKFARALLYVNKTSQHSTTAWGSIPIQDYSEKWWDKSIKEIDEELFKKYKVPKNISDYVKKNIQTKTEDNINNY